MGRDNSTSDKGFGEFRNSEWKWERHIKGKVDVFHDRPEIHCTTLP